MSNSGFRGTVARRFMQAAEAHGLFLRGFSVSSLLCLVQLNEAPMVRKERGGAHIMMGALVKHQMARWNAQAQHYEITPKGADFLKRSAQAGLVKLALELQAGRDTYDEKEVAA